MVLHELLPPVGSRTGSRVLLVHGWNGPAADWRRVASALAGMARQAGLSPVATQAGAWTRARFMRTAGLGHRRILDDRGVAQAITAFALQRPVFGAARGTSSLI